MVDFAIGSGQIQLVKRQRAATVNKSRVASGEEITIIPRWLWVSIGSIAATALLAIGGLATWALTEIISHGKQISVHEERLDMHGRSLESMKSALSRIDDKMDKVLERLNTRNP